MKFWNSAFILVAASASTLLTNAFVVVPPPSPSLLTSTTSRTTNLSMGIFSEFFGSSSSSTAPPSVTTPDISEGQVRALFYLWNEALATGDSRIVARRYSEDAILLPTASDEPRTDYDGIKDYYDSFLQHKPQGIIVEGKIKVGHKWAKDAGIYEFTKGTTGEKFQARYSFIYTYEYGQWKILHHHSSEMPQGGKKKDKITEDQVRNLFYLWNDALDTLDSDVVAKRYSENAVLLPTVSDAPRTDYESIKEYFDNFLKLKPQGQILESHVLVGDNWAKDVGIYEFTMRTNGSKVKARYSFVYIWEDGQWKISHHHSSVMPESKIGQKITKAQVRDLFHLWNDALATLDADVAAMRYAKEAVLLPTLSDTPHTDFDSIKDYYETFMERKPQVTILESYPLVGENWCKDVGIYEIHMGSDNTKEKCRYSFVYVYEDGEWKISHHHSSIMPESILANAAANQQKTLEEEMLQGKTQAV